MADLVFERDEKTLYWPKKRLQWDAISGPFGAGPLPPGLYDIGRREITGYTQNIAPSYRDSTGKGFFIPIYPRFPTSRGKYGGRLGIHPDGNVPGTLGCIGLTNADTTTFYEAIKETSAGSKLILLVK